MQFKKSKKYSDVQNDFLFLKWDIFQRLLKVSGLVKNIFILYSEYTYIRIIGEYILCFCDYFPENIILCIFRINIFQ